MGSLSIPSPADLPNPGIELGLLHFKWIHYQLSYQEAPLTSFSVHQSIFLTFL